MTQPARSEDFGLVLRRLMKEKRWSVRRLAEALGVSPGAVQHWRARKDWPARDDVEFYERLATALDCSLQEVVPPGWLLAAGSVRTERGDSMITRLPSFSSNQDTQFLQLALADMLDYLTKTNEMTKELQARLQRIEKASKGRKGDPSR